MLALAQRAEARSTYDTDVDATPTMAADERIHEEVVRALASRGRDRLSGTFRAAVFGANDGLVSNLALVLGVSATGAAAHAVLATGLAGLLAGALSMGAGEYVSVSSQRELLDASLPHPDAGSAVPRLDVDANELALIYRARGMDPAQASDHAAEVLRSQQPHLGGHRAAEGHAERSEAIGTGVRAAASSFCFFASGALIPVLPFLAGLRGTTALMVVAGLVGATLLATGAVVGLLSGRFAAAARPAAAAHRLRRCHDHLLAGLVVRQYVMPERHSLLAKTARAVRFSQPAGSRDIVSPYLRVAIMTAVGESQLQWAARPHAKGLAGAAAAPVLDVVVPVYNEERAVGPSIRRLHRYLREHFPLAARITIADNASVDATPCIAADLAEELDGVRVLRLEHKGRGRALQAASSLSDSPVLAYMDVDLSTDLAALAPLIAPLISGHSDVAIGTRLGSGRAGGPWGQARNHLALLQRDPEIDTGGTVQRCAVRVQGDPRRCGRAAAAARSRHRVVLRHRTAGAGPARRFAHPRSPGRLGRQPRQPGGAAGHRRADLKAIARLLRGFLTGGIPVNAIAEQLDSRRAAPPCSLLRQAVRFGAVGIASTAAYLLLFALLRGPAGAQPANLLALGMTAVANTAANRRFTFGVRGRAHLTRHHGEGLVVFGIALAITSAALAVLHALGGMSHGLEVIVLVAANLAATVIRFVLLRGWVFHPRRGTRIESAAA